MPSLRDMGIVAKDRPNAFFFKGQLPCHSRCLLLCKNPSLVLQDVIYIFQGNENLEFHVNSPII